jgi:surface polysaccharide O-acyltransferase-like enzyme
MASDRRLHHLDWLRVLAFGLLILYHVGMLYVRWPYHVKSPRIVPQLEWAMVLLNPWRLALLFFVSGVASRFLLGKLGPAAFARDRATRLLPTIAFGMLVVVPPQTYFELLQRGRWAGGFVPFWTSHYLRADATFGTPMPTWNHLWFLVYLLFYCLGLAALAAVVRARPSADGRPLLLALAPAAWLALTNLLASELRPDTHAFADDWAAHLRWVGLFAAGALAARAESFWLLVGSRRHALTAVAVALAAVHLAVRALIHAGWIGERWDGPAYAIASGLFGWAAILAILGLASVRLRQPSPALAYLNVAILPVYVLHQTVLIALAVALFPAGLPLGLEGALVVLGTLGTSLAAYELAIRRFGPLRFAFGLKRVRAAEAAPAGRA